MSADETLSHHDGANHEIFSDNSALFDENAPQHDGVKTHRDGANHEMFAANSVSFDENAAQHDGAKSQISEGPASPLNTSQYDEKMPEFLSQISTTSNNGSQHDGSVPEYLAQNSTSSMPGYISQISAASNDGKDSQHGGMPEFLAQNSTTSFDERNPQHDGTRPELFSENSNMSVHENTSQQNGNGKKPEYDYSDYYSYLLKNPWIQQAIATYDWTKHSNKLLESTLDRVETGVSTAAQTAAGKAVDVHQNYILRPKEAMTSAYNTGKEKTMNAVEASKNIAIKGGTVGLGAAVVAAQIGLAISAGGANLIINTVGGTYSVGQRVFTSLCEAEKVMEEKIWAAIAEGQRVAQIPVDKAADVTHAFLDVVSVFLEHALTITIEEVPDSSVKDRVARIARKTVEALNSKARTHVIEPASAQLQGLLEQLNKSFALADKVRERREWAQGKVDELSSSLSELKTRIENEAKQMKTKPEELLMKSICSTSVQLRNNLEKLKDNGQRIFGDVGRVESAINYLHDLDKNLGESNDIYQVRDEVLSEARQRIAELNSWTSSLLKKEKMESQSQATQ